MNSPSANTPAPTEEMLRVVDFNAHKLALLLYCSALPDDVKEAIVTLLPEMSIEQINEFLNVLEARYLDEQTNAVDSEYQEKLQVMMDSLQKKAKENEDQLADQIEMITKAI